MRLFNERYRKATKKALRHWMISELGHINTEHVHLHGIVFTDKPHLITDKWQYGFTWIGYENAANYVNEETVNYCTKYITKTDLQHPNYKPIILASPKIGLSYLTNNNDHKFKGEHTNTEYRTSTGHKIALPKYYKDRIYSDEEREALWMHSLDKPNRS